VRTHEPARAAESGVEAINADQHRARGPEQLAHALLAQYQGTIPLAELHDQDVSVLASVLHDFIDGYVLRSAPDGSARRHERSPLAPLVGGPRLLLSAAP
jgi:hypothetical protein